MIIDIKGKSPVFEKDTYLSENATVIGNVHVKEGASIWFGAVVRGDEEEIHIGKFSNIQDQVTIHTDEGYCVEIGEYVTVGHNAVVHGAVIGDGTLIGMNATVLNGAVIGKNCIIGANALVTEHMKIPDNSVVLGVPAKIRRETSVEQQEENIKNARYYVELARNYKSNSSG